VEEGRDRDSVGCPGAPGAVKEKTFSPPHKLAVVETARPQDHQACAAARQQTG